VVGSLFGNGVAAHLIGLVASLLACTAAVWLGMRDRGDRSRLDTVLVGAAVLSLVASPHAYPDDLVMLAPALVIGIAAALTFTSPVAPALGAWALITIAACADLIDAATFSARTARRVGACGCGRARLHRHRTERGARGHPQVARRWLWRHPNS
jgi:hypothetical protein